jgi:hypothetical protein
MVKAVEAIGHQHLQKCDDFPQAYPQMQVQVAYLMQMQMHTHAQNMPKCTRHGAATRYPVPRVAIMPSFPIC